MLKQKYFLADIFILSAEKQPIKLSWRKIVCLQKPNNPMLYYLVPVSKVKRKMSENALRKYQVGIPVCDLSFAD